MSSNIASVDNWSDSEIRTKLAELGTPVGPVTETTRKILVKKLKRLLQLQNSNVSGATKHRGSLAKYSSGDDSQEETSMPPPTVSMRNRRKTTGSSDFKTAVADSSIGASVSGRSDANKTYRERKSVSSVSVLKVQSKTLDTDSDSDVPIEAPTLRKSKRFETSFSDRSSLKPQSSYQIKKNEPVREKPWREHTPELVFPSHDSDISPNRSKFIQNTEDNAEEEEGDDEDFEEEEETEEQDYKTEFQSDLLKRLSSGGRFSTSYRSPTSDSIRYPKQETFRSPYSNYQTSTRPLDRYKMSSPHETLNSYSSGNTDRYSYLSQQSKSFSPSSSSRRTMSRMVSTILSFCNSNQKLIFGGLAVLTIFISVVFFSNFNTKIYLAAIDSDDNKYPICGQEGVDSSICVEQKNLNPALDVSKVVIPWILGLTSKAFCESSAGDLVDKPSVTEEEALKYLGTKLPTRRGQLEKDLRNFKVLLLSNPHWEVEVVSNGLDDIKAVLFNGNFAARSVDLPIGCYLRLTAYNTLKFLVYIALIVSITLAVMFGFKMYKLRQERHKQEVYKMVNNILNLLAARYEQNVLPGYVAINNCRDELIQPIERDVKKNIWKDAVDFIQKHESRVRTEILSVRGENVKVWHWLPAGSPPVSPSVSPHGASSPILGRLL